MSKPSGRSRTAARLAAVQALFQVEQGPEGCEQVIDQFVGHRLGKTGGDEGYLNGLSPDANVPLFMQIVRAACQDQGELDAMISGFLPSDWRLERLDPVLRAVMRAGCAELRMPDAPPSRAVINEYLDVAHSFFQGDEPGMANAVLDRIARQMRPSDFGAASAGSETDIAS